MSSILRRQSTWRRGHRGRAWGVGSWSTPWSRVLVIQFLPTHSFHIPAPNSWRDPVHRPCHMAKLALESVFLQPHRPGLAHITGPPQTLDCRLTGAFSPAGERSWGPQTAGEARPHGFPSLLVAGQQPSQRAISLPHTASLGLPAPPFLWLCWGPGPPVCPVSPRDSSPDGQNPRRDK